MIILLWLMLIPILSWFASKRFVQKQKIKRIALWFGMTWLFEVIALTAYIVVS